MARRKKAKKKPVSRAKKPAARPARKKAKTSAKVAGQRTSGKRKLAFYDKLLSDQPPHTELFRGSQAQLFPALYETIVRASDIQIPYEELDLALTEKFTVEEMGSNPLALRFLQMLVRMSGAKRVLEIGAFIGVSAMYLARALPDGGEVVTIERGAEFGAICAENFRRNRLEDKIALRVGDASEVIDSLPRNRKFGLIFIDGDKGHYGDYMRRLEPLLEPGGLMIVDDALFHGDVLNKTPTTDKGEGVRDALNQAAAWKHYHKALLPLSNGMLLLQKPR
jgi:caffeoyl-CoA O-methyltransferase